VIIIPISSMRNLCALRVSAVSFLPLGFTAEAQRTRIQRREIKLKHAAQSLRDRKRLPAPIMREAFFGRDDWIRTSGLTHPKGARYQAAPRPVKTFSV
jgi:hypothetical protein